MSDVRKLKRGFTKHRIPTGIEDWAKIDRAKGVVKVNQKKLFNSFGVVNNKSTRKALSELLLDFFGLQGFNIDIE